MSKYKKRHISISSDDAGYESGYESDGGTKYSPVKPLGKGGYAQARLFRSACKKEVTVLNPVTMPGDMGEAAIKQRFFLKVYPNNQSHLFTIAGGDYRLVVPYVPYIPYHKLTIDTPEIQLNLFCSAAQALKDCHDKGIIVIDLKEDNIYYDSSTQKSYLIDGGLSAPTGTTIDPLAFQKSTPELVENYKLEYTQIPPECWSVKPTPVLATPKMDIYALGIMMSDLFKKKPDSELQALINHCLEEDPDKRPTLTNLIASLDSIQRKRAIVETVVLAANTFLNGVSQLGSLKKDPVNGVVQAITSCVKSTEAKKSDSLDNIFAVDFGKWMNM
jgi:serine/threonine protein kinase